MVCVNHTLTQKGCYRAMEPKMSQITRTEVLVQKRDRYARAGKEHKTKIINELVELFGYHRKAAIRALQPRVAGVAPYVRGRPKDYDPAPLLPPRTGAAARLSVAQSAQETPRPSRRRPSASIPM